MSAFPKAIELREDQIRPDGRVRPSLRMTEEEFLAWVDEDARAEWVDGEVIVMSPSSLRHVRLANWLVRVVSEFVERKSLGEILGPEFMIRLGAQRRIRVPDLLFIANDRLNLLRPTYLEGAPDLSIEILSPDSQSRDRRHKFAEYEKAGVREYWMVDPVSQTIEAYALDAGREFQLIDATDDGRVLSAILPGFYLRPQWLWQEKLPDVITTLREIGIQF